MRLNRRNFLSAATAAFLPWSIRAEAETPASDGFRVLTVAKTDAALLPAPEPKTAQIGFGAQCPGPPLLYKKGEEIKIRLVNSLDAPITFSCQGMRIANAMDGVAGLTQSPVPPGHSFDYRFTPPDAGFYWYRSSVEPLAITQLDHGLYGPLIVQEANPPTVDRDIPIILADWHLNQAAQIETAAAAKPNDHYVVTLNGASAPSTMEFLPGARLRLRLLSVVQSQLVFVSFTRLKPWIVAIDGQPCEAFEPLRLTIPVGPGACFDVLCDLPAESGAQGTIAWRTGERSDRPLLIFNTRATPRPKLPPFASLPANPLLPATIPLQHSRKVDLVVDAGAEKGKDGTSVVASDTPHGPLTLNGKAASNFAAAPLFSVRRGTPVTLGFINKSALLVQVHVHGHTMRLLHDLDDGWEPYWRNRVIVPEARGKHTAFIADNPGKWAIEFQTLEMTPNSLVTWFEVI